MLKEFIKAEQKRRAINEEEFLKWKEAKDREEVESTMRLLRLRAECEKEAMHQTSTMVEMRTLLAIV